MVKLIDNAINIFIKISVLWILLRWDSPFSVLFASLYSWAVYSVIVVIWSGAGCSVVEVLMCTLLIYFNSTYTL